MNGGDGKRGECGQETCGWGAVGGLIERRVRGVSSAAGLSMSVFAFGG